MPKLFGTDGVRGIANKELSPELAFKLGEAGANFLRSKGRKLVVGRDTRFSGDLLESALVAGICAAGCRALLLGIIPTPAIAYLTKKFKADGGVVISASHNPAEYNGIKFFDAQGVKLSEEAEEKIESLIDAKKERPTGTKVGRLLPISFGEEEYLNHVVNTIYGDLEGLKVAIDCANGSAYRLAPLILKELGAQVLPFSVKPNGFNINLDCGSTHPQYLQEIVRSHEVDLGLAFDGDADRVIAIDENGEVVDGDYIMAICALHLKELDFLNPKLLITTVMTNLGFDLAMQENGIKVVKTPVGDRYVLFEMLSRQAIMGGEQSGHIIFLNHNSTGDGLITALQLLSVIRDKGKPLSELKKVMASFPQVLLNLKVEKKERLNGAKKLWQTVDEFQKKLGSQGRILVRSSGTEPFVRVMVETKDQEEAEQIAQKIGQIVEEELGCVESSDI